MTENLTHIDTARIKRLITKGHLQSLLDEFEKLRLLFVYEQKMTEEETIKFITLCKYFMQYGPTESFRLSCRLLHDKYIKPHNL